MRDHPMIEAIEKTGYPNEVAQPEHNGTDFYGSEILEGDIFVEYDGEVVLMENLERYLTEQLGFSIKTAI